VAGHEPSASMCFPTAGERSRSGRHLAGRKRPVLAMITRSVIVAHDRVAALRNDPAQFPAPLQSLAQEHLTGAATTSGRPAGYGGRRREAAVRLAPRLGRFTAMRHRVELGRTHSPEHLEQHVEYSKIRRGNAITRPRLLRRIAGPQKYGARFKTRDGPELSRIESMWRGSPSTN